MDNMAKPKHERSVTQQQEQAAEPTIPPDAQAREEAAHPETSDAQYDMIATDDGPHSDGHPPTHADDPDDRTAFEKSTSFDGLSTEQLKAVMRASRDDAQMKKLAAFAAEAHARAVEDALCRRALAANSGKGAIFDLDGQKYKIKKRIPGGPGGGGGYQFIPLREPTGAVTL